MNGTYDPANPPPPPLFITPLGARISASFAAASLLPFFHLALSVCLARLYRSVRALSSSLLFRV